MNRALPSREEARNKRYLYRGGISFATTPAENFESFKLLGIYREENDSEENFNIGEFIREEKFLVARFSCRFV